MKKASEIINNFPGCDRVQHPHSKYRVIQVIQGVDFSGTSFQGTHLDLDKIRFVNCNFTNCDFTNCVLINPSDGLYAEKCDFTGANFGNIATILLDLKDCVLHETDFSRASYWNTNFFAWDLSTAKIDLVWDDLFKVLAIAVPEIPALEKAIRNGRIDGSVYSNSGCGCLNGTLHRAAEKLGDAAIANNLILAQDHRRPIELFCWDIAPGDRPETNWKLRILLEKIQEFKESLTSTR